MQDRGNGRPAPPEIGPFVFPTLLALFGAWCFYDGWISTSAEMQEHVMFNRIGSVVLLSWALIDFIRTRRAEKEQQSDPSENIETQDDK